MEQRISPRQLFEKMNGDKRVTFSATSSKTGRTLVFHSRLKREVFWVYLMHDGTRSFLGWVRYVRQNLVLVRGNGVPDSMLPFIKAFQYVLDARQDEGKAARITITTGGHCYFCGARLERDALVDVCAACEASV